MEGGGMRHSITVVMARIKFWSIPWYRCSYGFLVSFILTAPTQAASFDCSKAAAQVEKFVCDNPVISKLDDQLGNVFQENISKASDEQRQRLTTEQEHWFKYTRNACNDEPCFKHAYWSRLAELKTFFEPHSPLYKKEADKADAIKQLLATAPLYYSEGKDKASNKFCTRMFDDLKRMKGIDFVDPVVQTQSYEDPALDRLKQQCRNTPPLNFSYSCDGRIATLYEEETIEGMKIVSDICAAGYGLPPFKFFELPPLKSSQKKHYVFYSDDSYGPMNQDWREPHSGGGDSGFYKLSLPGCKLQGSFTQARGGARNGPNYNSVITYRGQYYIIDLYNEYGSYWMSVETVIQKPLLGCRWSPVNPDTTSQGNK